MLEVDALDSLYVTDLKTPLGDFDRDLFEESRIVEHAPSLPTGIYVACSLNLYNQWLCFSKPYSVLWHGHLVIEHP